MNIYITSESSNALSKIFTNIKNFYVFDVLQFIKGMNIDATAPASIYMINTTILKSIEEASKLKKYKGIIYSVKELNSSKIDNIRLKFGNIPNIEKFILIDNDMSPRHTDIYGMFKQIIFFRRFTKNKIIMCSGISKEDNQILMNDNE